jgi:hypothetical protein
MFWAKALIGKLMTYPGPESRIIENQLFVNFSPKELNFKDRFKLEPNR